MVKWHFTFPLFAAVSMEPTGSDPYESRFAMRLWLDAALLRGTTVLLAAAFAGRAILRGGRATHTLGVGAGGHLRVVDKPKLPDNNFFTPGRTFPILARHATALRKDEVERDFRSLAIKLFDGERADALDLIMNTGHVQGFWHAANFIRGAIGGALGEFGRHWYIRGNPPAFENVIAGIRRSPKSYTQLSYYAAISFDLVGLDGSRHLVRFRVIPHNREPDDGSSTGEDLRRPWFEDRLPEEDRGEGWLRAEYAARLSAGDPARYVLQTQVRPHTPEQQAYNIGLEWDDRQYPWSDLANISLDRLLDPDATESLRFRIDHQPPCLGIPQARSPWDYRSIGWMRPSIYRWMQNWRHLALKVRKALGFGSVPRWDRLRVREQRVWHRPNSFTVILDVVHQPEALISELVRVGDSIGKLPETPFHRITTLHFFRMQVIHAEQPRLLIDWVFNGPVAAHIDEFLIHVGSWFEGLLRRHAGVTGSIRAALHTNAIQAQALFSGDVGGTVDDVLREQRLREVVGEFIDKRLAEGGWPPETSPEAIRKTIRSHILAAADSKLPSGPRQRRGLLACIGQWSDASRSFASPWSGTLRSEIRRWLLPPSSRYGFVRRVISEGLLAAHFLWTAIPTAWFLARARSLERQEANSLETPGTVDIDALVHREDHQAQNPLTMLCDVRNHPHRRWLLARILNGANDASKHLWNQGGLAGINTIHCARFLLIEDGRRLIFMSDYDGSWDRYLNDFLSVGSVAVVPIFTNVIGCPPTQSLFGTTPGFGERFLTFTREKQTPVHLWYTAWPSLSLRNRIANSKLREGLFIDSMSEAAALAWLQEVL
jgi:hypothetical protein